MVTASAAPRGIRATCESDSHARGILAPPFRTTPRAAYAVRVCQECGRIQGVARTVTAAS